MFNEINNFPGYHTDHWRNQHASWIFHVHGLCLQAIYIESDREKVSINEFYDSMHICGVLLVVCLVKKIYFLHITKNGNNSSTSRGKQEV